MPRHKTPENNAQQKEEEISAAEARVVLYQHLLSYAQGVLAESEKKVIEATADVDRVAEELRVAQESLEELTENS